MAETAHAAAQEETVSSGSAEDAVEVADGRLFRLGSAIELDGRISWAPKIPGRWTPHNNFIAMDGDRAYLLDTGVSAHRDQIIRQIKSVLAPDVPLTAFLTRSEFACAGNLGAICADRGINELVSSARNPFAASDEIASELQHGVRRTNLERGAVAPLGSSETLVVIPPLVRLLSTYWVYDQVSRTMFTSDLFGHVSIAGPDDPVVLSDPAEDTTTYEEAREHTLLRYHWVPMATTDVLVTWLKTVFDTYDVEIIAATSGRILKGKPIVERHFGLIVDFLERVPQESS